jgi:hypothetical protein
MCFCWDLDPPGGGCVQIYVPVMPRASKLSLSMCDSI